MHDELRVAGSSNQLASVIAAEVCTALTLLARKAEVMAATGPDVRNVPERAAAHPAQLRNIALCSSLQDVHRWGGAGVGGGGGVKAILRSCATFRCAARCRMCTGGLGRCGEVWGGVEAVVADPPPLLSLSLACCHAHTHPSPAPALLAPHCHAQVAFWLAAAALCLRHCHPRPFKSHSSPLLTHASPPPRVQVSFWPSAALPALATVVLDPAAHTCCTFRPVLLPLLKRRSLSGLLPRLPASATAALAPALTQVQGAAVDCVAPIFKSVMDSLEDRVLRMHSMNYDDDHDGGASAAGSEEKAGSSGGGSAAGVINTSLHIQDCVILMTSFK